ncbi:hypothetical protein BZA77DRAFT_315136 [Pyronema omphalodes]|nr:hypothetical protein BZA77DRAFT_315136 [Pyronema omphalodes]
MDETAESEHQSASSEAETVDSIETEQIETEDEQPSGRRSKVKVPAGAKIAGQKATKESYKCIIKPCHLDIAPREEENEGDDLAPISKLDTIFGDIIDRVLDHVADLMGDKKHRKIRVATMCSGTESPILALGMFAKAIKERGLGNFEVEHVFSCEIEPYKQAYIERNFKPPILFRDIRELGGDTATTAYGAEAAVPGDVDILIAGTSCVDFSNLNNKQKNLEEGGESGDTFLGMMRWVQKHRPLMVIQENVSGAAWTEMRQYFMDRDYSAEFHRVNSRDYYIPHTRQRGYLFALNVKNSSIPNKWIDAVKKMKRPSTATLEAFMLADDDPRVYKGRMDLAGDSRNGPAIRARTVEWEKCEGRHQRERAEKHLGDQRPVTAWQEGGVSKVLDFMWQDWGAKQVDRVPEQLYNTNLNRGFWNLSQNVDRNTMGGDPNGICPCLTPHMIAFLCHRGGPMTGIESLHMQGLPIDELLLTRETSQQIQDLAGNAMTSTVVGISMLMALILAKDHLQDRTPALSEAMEIDEPEVDEGMIIGADQLAKTSLDLSTTISYDLKDILSEAVQSSRLCVCEGRFTITKNKIRSCKECGFTVCEKCGGRPSHVVDQPEIVPDRITPLHFEAKLKSILPMRLQFSTVDEATLDKLRSTKNIEHGNIWKKLVTESFRPEFRFKGLVRQEKWVVNYDAPNARMEFILHPEKPEWRLFAKAPENDGKNAPRRKMCDYPIARMFVNAHGNDALSGKWELCIPTISKFQVKIEGIGKKVPSYHQRLGFTELSLMNSQVWSGLRITIPEEHKDKFDRDVSGDYRLLENCGTALASLHIRDHSPDGMDKTPMFFFVDQERIGNAENDSFVFSEEHGRLGYGETRPIFGKLVPTWRQSDVDGVRNVNMAVRGKWVPIEAKCFPPVVSAAQGGEVLAPSASGIRVVCSHDACQSAHTLLECHVPLGKQAEPIWPEDKWVDVDEIHGRETYESLAWLTERVKSVQGVSKWSVLEYDNLENCERCAPTPPQLYWIKDGKKFKAVEDSQQAAPYERALKARPRPFITHLKLDTATGTGLLKIGINIPSLIHRALARFPNRNGDQKYELSWRLVTDYVPEPSLLLPFYDLVSNKRDSQSQQPPGFKCDLRPEQLRSLSWMKAQEGQIIKPFMEEEVAEALLPHMNWRAEGKAMRANFIRGGVLADEVGYGKTAITIGLIASTQADIELPENVYGAIPVKATLVIVPAHLVSQWVSEIKKFTHDRFKVLTISDKSFINSLSVKDMKSADIIVVTATLFQSDAYLNNLAEFSGAPPSPGSKVNGRRFMDWHKDAMDKLAAQIELLKTSGPQAVKKRIEEAAKENAQLAQVEIYVAKGRKIGSAYVESKIKAGDKRKNPTSDDETTESPATKKKTKTANGKAAAKKTATHDWRLNIQSSNGDYSIVRSLPFQAYHFNRLVVDEFTYVEGQIRAGITSQKSWSRWVLSGTPPLEDFNDVKSIAQYLNAYLGIDDDSVASVINKKRMKAERTAVESFRAFKELNSPYWHTRRQEIAQSFLHHFVRQNYAEIDEIPWEEHIVSIQLPAAERAIYLELNHYLMALDYNIKRGRAKNDNDRDRRQQEALGDSQTAEEALIKRCSHFDLDDEKRNEKNAVQACDVIVSDRKRQLQSCREDIRASLQTAYSIYGLIKSSTWQEGGPSDNRPRDLFGEFVKQCLTGGVGDPAATEDIQAMIREAEGRSKGKKIDITYSDGTTPANLRPIPPKTKKEKEEEDLAIMIATLKEKVMYLRALVRKELTGRHRSLRYFTVVRDIQKSAINKKVMEITCIGCKKTVPEADIAVLSSCGHQGCYNCVNSAAHRAQCLTAGCSAATRALAVVRADTLGAEDIRDGIGRHHGKKLEVMVQLIKERIPADEKILLFVQFQDLRAKVAKVLDESGISYCQVQGNAKKQSDIVEKFQQSIGIEGPRIMLLDVTTQSASGSNFTNANHCIFISPLLTETDHQYKAFETQAIGRVRRYGQTKKVHIWRFMASDTMDVETYEKRTGELRDSEAFRGKIYDI